MSSGLAHFLSVLVLAIHAGVVLFNIFWMIAIPLGGWFGWRFVRSFSWRAAHIASLIVVAAQPLLGRYCFLTLWQEALKDAAGPEALADPGWLERALTLIVFWPLPEWIFVYLYVAAAAWTVSLWWIVPPNPPPWSRKRTVPTSRS
jgi:hypothetical protein